MAEVQVGFRAINSDIALTVFIWIQGAGIHIDVGIKFLNRHFVPSCLQQFCQGCTYDSLSETAAYSSRNKNVTAVAPACEGL